MDFEKITINGYTLLIILYFLGSTILSNIAAATGPDFWLVYLIGLVVGIVFTAMYNRILQLHDFRSFPDILERLFGYWPSKLFCAIYAIFFLMRTDMVGEITTEMATDLLMNDAPRRLTVSILLFTTLYACHKGLRAIGRSTQIITVLIGICLLPFLLTAFSSPAFIVKNLQPFLVGGIQDFWQKTLAVCITPYTEIGLFAVLAVHVERNHQKLIFSRQVIAMTVSTLLLILVGLINLSILGKYLVFSLKYPFYNAMMLTGLHGVLERLDPLAVIIVIASSFYKVAVLFYCWIEMGTAVSSKIKRNGIIIGTAILMFSGILNINYLYEKFQNVILPFQVMPLFQVVIPVLLWIISEIKFYFERKREIGTI